MSNIFSPNYSVGTVLCTLQCPGSGMAWWVMAGAKLRPPLIVLSLDFPYSPVSMCGTSALPLPSWPGRLTAQCRGWCGVSSTGCVNSQTPSVWTCLFLISAILVLIQSRWKIPQLCTNLSSCEVSDLLLPPADASCVAPLLWFLSWMPGASCAAAARLRAWLERAGERGRHCSTADEAVPNTHRKKAAARAARATRAFWNVLCGSDIFSPSKACGWHTNEWDAYQHFFFLFTVLCKWERLANICIILKARSEGCSGFNRVPVIG